MAEQQNGKVVIDTDRAKKNLEEIEKISSNALKTVTPLIESYKDLYNSYANIIQNDGKVYYTRTDYLTQKKYYNKIKIVHNDKAEKFHSMSKMSSIPGYSGPAGLDIEYYNTIKSKIDKCISDLNAFIAKSEKGQKEVEEAIEDPYDYGDSDGGSSGSKSGGSSSGGAYSSSGGSSSGGSSSGGSSSGGSSNSTGYTSSGTVGQVVSDSNSKVVEDSLTEENSNNVISIDNPSGSSSSSSTSSDASVQTSTETKPQGAVEVVTPASSAVVSEYEAIPKTGLGDKESSHVKLVPIAAGAALGAGVAGTILRKKDSKEDQEENKDKN